MFARIGYLVLTLVITLYGSASLQANVKQSVDLPSNTEQQTTYLLVAAKSKDRRDNRQDDRGRSDDREERRDCRDDEGAVGKDKRDCKQDSRQGKTNKDDKDDKDG